MKGVKHVIHGEVDGKERGEKKNDWEEQTGKKRFTFNI